ncbi:tail length tape measure protein [Paracidovorax avenae]|uniref:tape measure protein n=1 Tax=Paracidovorax avenae TaxID=80867 RepID=UPI000D22B396|nr:tape measure protein [Paracidovorax avenae]AVS67847.1 tail length tape measure protein [Paracidovorax avenae]
MSDDLKEEIVIGSNTTGVEAGVNRVKRSLADLGVAAGQAGKAAASGMGAAGEGGDRASKKVESATRSMQASLQRLIAEQQAGSKSSREYWEALASQRNVNVAALKPLLDQLDGARAKTDNARAATTGWRDEIAKVGPMLAGVLAGVSFAGFVGKLVSVQREFDVLYSSLKTVAGGAAAAEREMSWLKDFARETPFGLAQATQAFVKMKSLGLEPTRAALTSFGNTASAMGKGLDQMIEAVADASTSEFERLREFGIKAKQEGDKVELTFQGVSKTIGNNAQEIVKYLEDIGNAQFAGAMEERAKTLDGAISALGDTWDELFRTVNERNTGNLIYDSVMLATGAVEQATTVLRAMTEAASGSAEATGALKTIQEGIGTVFETVAVLGVNVAYTLQQVGNELGGLAAQAVQAAQFNFAGVRAIREQMVADAETARREVDATTSRIMRARKEQEEYARWASRNASAATDPRRVDLGARPSVPSDGKKKTGVDAEARAYESLTKAIGEKIAQERAELEGGRALTESQKYRIKIEQELHGVNKARALALVDVLEAQEREKAGIKRSQAAYQEYVVTQKELAEAEVERTRAVYAGRQAVTDYVKGLDEANKMMEFELSIMGLSEQAREVALEQYRIELELKKQIAAVNRNEGFDQGDRDEEIARLTAAAARAKANASNKVFLDEWKSSVKQYDDIFRQGFADMLNRGEDGWKSFTRSLVTTFKTTVADQIYKMFLQPFVVQIVGQIVGMTGGGGLLGAFGGGTGGSPMGMASNAYSLYNTGSQLYTIGSQYLGGTMSGANAFGTMWGNATGTGIDGLLATNGAYGTAGGAGGAGAGGMSALAGAGAFLAVAAVIANMFGAFASRQMVGGGLRGTLGGDDLSAYQLWRTGGTLIGGPSYNIKDPGKDLADSEKELQTLRESGQAASRRAVVLQDRISYIKDRYGDQIAQGKKQSDAIQQAYDAMRTGVGNMADVLGIDSKAVRAYKMPVGTDSIDDSGGLGISFAGLDADGISKKVQEALATANNALAEQVIGSWVTTTEKIRRTFEVRLPSQGDNTLNDPGEYREDVETVTRTRYVASEFAREGENAIATLTRLAGSLSTVNGVFETLGTTLYKSSLAGGDMASKLIDVFGNADKFVAATGDYFQRFYSPEEQRAAARKQLEKQLGTLDIKLPDIDASDARAQYRKLVEAQDLTTESGRKAYAMLVQLAGAFDAVAVASQDAAAAAAEAARRQEEAATKRIDLYQRLLVAQGKEGEALALRRSQELAALAKLDPALVKMAEEIYRAEDAAAALVKAQQGREAAYGRLQNAATLESERLNALLEGIDAQRTALGQQRALADESLSLITGIFGLVRSNARELYGQVESTAAMQAAQGWAFVEQALATARATGYLPEQAPLQEAIGAARGGVETRAYATQFEQDRDRLVLAGMLSGLEGISGKQKTAAEQQIKLLEDQGKALDLQTETINRQLKAQQEMLEYWRRQIDIANGTFDATLSVAAAIDKLATALGKPPATPTTKPPQGGGPEAVWGGSAPGAGSTTAQPEAKYRRVTSLGTSIGYTPVIDQALIAKLDGLSGLYHSFDGTGDLIGLLTTIRTAGGTLDDLSILSGFFYSDWVKAAASVGIPAFAVGTNYVPYDTPAIVHKGERIIPAADNRALMAALDRSGQGVDGAVLAELQALRAEVAALRAAGERTADNTAPLAGMADQLEQVTEGGNAMRVEVMNQVEVMS